MKLAIAIFNGTTSALVLPSVHLFFTNNPGGNIKLYREHISLHACHQQVFDNMTNTDMNKSQSYLQFSNFKCLKTLIVDSTGQDGNTNTVWSIVVLS